jgi:lipid-binding SYLF domain-containing protein
MRAFAIAASFLACAALLPADTAQERLRESATVFSDVMRTPDKGIPQDLLDKAQCAIVVPNLKKGAFVVGGEYGRGYATCRNSSGTGWGAPAAVRVEGGSVGFQIGGSSTDVIMLVMNRRGMDKLMGDKFTLGADASVAAGPVGRTAEASTNVRMDAEILAWSRSKGLFAGLSLGGATLRPDKDVNHELYGRDITPREILNGEAKTPAGANDLAAALDKYSMRGEPNAERKK